MCTIALTILFSGVCVSVQLVVHAARGPSGLSDATSVAGGLVPAVGTRTLRR